MAHTPPGELLDEARLFYKAVRRDFSRGLWSAYEQHSESYNRLVRQCFNYSGTKALLPIAPLSDNDLRSPRLQLEAERVKLAEVVQKAELLSLVLTRASRSTGTAGVGVRALPRSERSVQELCERFHRVAAQLGSSRRGRRRWQVADEYDVQTLLHGLLLLYFDDVRAEEWTPSRAGASARMDFLIPEHRIVVEAKMTRQGLGSRQVGDQLIADIERYQSHPSCRTLICLVYDPNALLTNPRGLERDLMGKSSHNLRVIVAVRP